MFADAEPPSRRLRKNCVIFICSLWVGWGVFSQGARHQPHIGLVNANLKPRPEDAEHETRLGAMAPFTCRNSRTAKRVRGWS